MFDYGRDRQGLIPLWVGEGDLPTPPFIIEAAKASLDRGETFYTHQAGIPELREAIASYMTRVYGSAPGGGDFSPERFFVTIGGMHALDIAVRLTVGPGQEALVLSPAWPNFAGALSANGARARYVPLDRGETWRLDPERLAAAVGPATRAILFNSPANPTGYVATEAELIAVLDLARARDLWIVADEIYGRLTYGGRRAPSFHDIMRADDKILFVQTFSKNWAMTGWRIGWLEAPPALGPTIENLVQYSTSGVPVSAQRAAVAALEEGEAFLADFLASLRASRDIVADGLAATGRVRFARPEAAFYLFCAVEGETGFAPARSSPDRRGRDRRGAGRGFRSRRRGLSAHMFRARARRNGRGDPPLRALARAVSRLSARRRAGSRFPCKSRRGSCSAAGSGPASSVSTGVCCTAR